MTVMSKELKHRICIQSLEQIPNQDGGYDPDYTTLRKIWGNVKSISGREIFNHLPMNEGATHRIKVRFRTDINRERFLLWERTRAPSVRFKILSTREEDDALVIVCQMLEEAA